MRPKPIHLSLLSLLLFALCACSSPPPGPVALPAAWPEFTAAPGITAKLDAPREVAAKAALISARIVLTNTGTQPRTLSVPTPCDIEDWRLLDAAGHPVMAKHPETCSHEAQSRTLAPGASLQADVFLGLGPEGLRSGQHYTIDYRFWGQRAVAGFTAR